METILNYLDNMFLNYQQTPEVLRAKKDLAEMMEDKYSELIAEGKIEHEAIGIVISEFGNIQELAEELDIKLSEDTDTGMDDKKEENTEEPQDKIMIEDKAESEYTIHLSQMEGDEYLFAVKQSSVHIAAGVFLCICSPALLILLTGIQDCVVPISDAVVSIAGISVLLCMVASAVGLFISAGMKLETYNYLKKECFTIDEKYKMYVINTRESRKDNFKIKITAGVIMCILSVIPLIIPSFLDSSSDLPGILSVIFLLMIVGAAVSLFITAGMEQEAYKIILQEKEFSVYKKSRQGIVDIISSFYWPLIVIIYLVSSFMSNGWAYTWIIWVIAGILFDVICKIIESSAKKA